MKRGSSRTGVRQLASVCLFLSLATLPLVLAFGCGSDLTDGEGGPNQAPTVELTSGPMEGDEVSYSVRMEWSGADPDGFVDRFEYALDPHQTFTEEEIRLGGPELEYLELVRPLDQARVTRVRKLVDGTWVFFDWIQTQDFSRRFEFRLGEKDAPENPVYEAQHRLFVRAVDNQGSLSAIESRSFTSQTIAPRTEITWPSSVGTSILQTGENIRIRWIGTDMNPSGSIRNLTYEYKLLRIDTLDPPFPLLPGPRLLELRTEVPWVQTDLTEIEFQLETPGNYIFGVRAIHKSGAKDPFLDYVRDSGEVGNVFKFSALGNYGPNLTVSNPILGDFCFRQQCDDAATVIAGHSYVFTAQCDVQDSGSDTAEITYAIDLESIDQDLSWKPLDPFGRTEPLQFNDQSPHYLYFRCQDDFGEQQIHYIELNPVELLFDRDILIIDDWKDGIWPVDETHDQFWRDLAANSGRFSEEDLRDAYLRFDVFGDKDIQFREPSQPKLEFLGQHRLLIFDTSANGYNGRSALTSLVENKLLGLYLSSGGKVWISGESTVAAMDPTVTGQADFAYPKEDLQEGDFAYDFLKLRTTRIENDKNVDNYKNGLTKANPFPKVSPLSSLRIDREKRSPIIRNEGIGSFDAIYDKIDLPKAGVVENLYLSQTNELRSTFNNKLIAVRWHDPDPTRTQGRVAWFGFPMYYMQDEDAQEVFNQMIDWFGEGP